MFMNKNCTRCLKEFPINSFKIINNKTGKKCSMCLSCIREYNREYYKNHFNENKKQTKNILAKKRIDKVKHYIINYLSQNSCIDCSEKRIEVLEFDHINDDKEFDISYAISRGFSLETIKKEIEKCVVRCANCHRVKTSNQLGWWKSTINKIV